MPILASLWRDVCHTARMLLKDPGFTAGAVLMLGLGIGATTAIFSVVNGVLVKPLPYPDPDTLVRIVHSIGGTNQPYFSDRIYLNYIDNTTAFLDIGVWSPEETATLTGTGDPEEVPVLKASRGLLSTLGVNAEIGRWFTTAEDTRGSPDVVMLAHGYWQRRFGGNLDVVGRMLTVNGRLHRIIGIMPAHFRFGRDFDIILPLRVDQAWPTPVFRLLGVARMKQGVTIAQANSDALRGLHVLFEESGTNPVVRARWAASLQPLKQDVLGDVAATLWILMGAIGIVLLLACANVANLLLVRADARRQEFAVRATLGANWTQMARQLLIESLTLAFAGGILGLGLAYAGVQALIAIGPTDLPRLHEISMDFTVLGFTLAVSTTSGLFFGIIPILKYVQPRLADSLAASRTAGVTRERQRSQQTLVAAQLALALVLLVSAGLMIRSFQTLRNVDPGFREPERVQTLSVSIPASIVPQPERVIRIQQEVLEKIAALPGVSSVAFATRLPVGSSRSSAAILVEGRGNDDDPPPTTPPNHQVKVVSPSLFRTLGIPFAAGRDFDWTDVYDRREVAIVSENLARELWGSSSAALGKRIREFYDKEAPWREIVGVAGNVHDDGADQPAPATMYWPTQPHPRYLQMSGFQGRRVSFAIRTGRAGTPQLLIELQQAVWSVNDLLPLADVRTLDDLYGQSMARTSFTFVILAVAGTMALLLGLSGIYGVISYAVSLRRREIGIRLALGAQSTDIRTLFVRQGLLLAGIGTGVGLCTAAGLTWLMRSLLFGVSPLDPIIFASTPVLLGAAAALTSLVPTRRALAVDPVESIKSQ